MRYLKPTQEVYVDINLLKWLPDGEEVRIIPNTHYAISETGRIFSGKEFLEYRFIDDKRNIFPNWKEIFPHINNGYWAINLSNNGKVKKYYVHDLLFDTFRGEHSKHYFKIIFVDGCRDNLHIDNLRLQFRSARVRGEYIYRMKFTCLRDGTHDKYIVNLKPRKSTKDFLIG